MKPFFKSFLILVTCLAASFPANAQRNYGGAQTDEFEVKRDKQKDVYIFGVASNLKDSVAYLTAVQVINGAVIQQGTGFLLGRSLYSNQLKYYIENQEGKAHEIPIVFYDTDKKNILKKYRKVQKTLLAQQDVFLRMLDTSDFFFQTVARDEIVDQGHIMERTHNSKQEAPQDAPQGFPQGSPQGPPPSSYGQP